MTATMLVDRYGRQATDLRLSLTDRCNLRCRYCMPADGLNWLPAADLLTDVEVIRLARIAVGLGVRHIRLTGGEPLLRPRLPELVAGLAELLPRPSIALTTNGLRLADLARPLAEAGLDRVNVSLDTLRADVFRRVARRPGLERVLAGLRAAREAGLRPVKVNAVLLRGINDGEASALLRFCLREDLELRFIEAMPLDGGGAWRREEMVSAQDILTALSDEFDLSPAAGRGSEPAESWLVDGGPGRVGIIGSVTRPFCASCDRVRLTSEGQVLNCLFARTESDLRGPMRSGATDAELERIWVTAVAGKALGHGIDDPDFQPPRRSMSAIGG